MKFLLTILTFAAFTQTSYATCDDHSKTEGKKVEATEFTKQLKIKGMSCDTCVSKVEKELKKITLSKGIKFVVSLNLVTIDFSENKTVSKKDLAQVVKQAETAITAAKFNVIHEG